MIALLQIFSRLRLWKNFENRPGFDGVMPEILQTLFFPDTVYITGAVWMSFDWFADTIQGSVQWLNKDRQLTGFPWSGGTERLTSGIDLWSEPFICELPNGELVETKSSFSWFCRTVFRMPTTVACHLPHHHHHVEGPHQAEVFFYKKYFRLWPI